MILYVEGNLFRSPAQVLVNTVNTVGVMGKGVALEFKQLFPDMYEQYRELCEQGKFDTGMLWLYKSPNKWVLNFPTKKHWRNPSRIEYIEAGLQKFVQSYAQMGIHSIAFPPLGCGNGQLDFETQVQPLMHRYLRNLPIDVFIYPEKESRFIEHLNQGEMQEWLRAEPISLPFTEVWDDLVQLLEHKNEYYTLSQENPFEARISRKPLGIEVQTSNRRFILYEDLMAFWQQLRDHGFSTRQIAPGIDRVLSYLIPIFQELEYVVPVYLNETFGSESAKKIGLQILPSAFTRRQNQNPLQPVQLQLFPVG